MEKKYKIVWLCGFSNKKIHDLLPLQLSFDEKMIMSLKHQKKTTDVEDFAQWITNAINEVEEYLDKIELHIISPYPYLKYKKYSLACNGINYHFFRNSDKWVERIHKRFPRIVPLKYINNRLIISSFVGEISPDLIHCIGAENPFYGLSLLDIPRNIPIILQLQTLMSDPEFEKNYPISHQQYKYMSNLEKKLIRRSDYIGTRVQKYIKLIKKTIKEDAVILNTSIAVAEKIWTGNIEKKYDFVYFARNINKAADWAVEAFSLVNERYPNVTLNIIGDYSPSFISQLKGRIRDLGLENNIFFSGLLPTHSDVIAQVRKSRFALLPLKIDILSGTIREAMANGLPVVSTITPGTPSLNIHRKTALLSEPGNFKEMASNMIHLIEDDALGNELRNNAFLTLNEKYNNKAVVEHWINTYIVVMDCFKKGIAIPNNFLSNNVI